MFRVLNITMLNILDLKRTVYWWGFTLIQPRCRIKGFRS